MSEPTGSGTSASRPENPEPTAAADADRKARGLRRAGRRGSDDSAPVAPTPGAQLADGVDPTDRRGNPVAWTSLLVAAVLTIWQVAYALSIERVSPASQDLYTSVSLFVSLVLALSAAVLGVVGIAQRRHPRWPALAGLAVGLNVFLVSVFSWIADLMNSAA